MLFSGYTCNPLESANSWATGGLVSTARDGGQGDWIGPTLTMMTLDLDRHASKFFSQRIRSLIDSIGKISPTKFNLDKIDRKS
jgi:hypothetical protein